MDHIPTAAYGVALPTVPLLCGTDLDLSGPFLEYPSRHGYDIDAFVRLDFTAKGTRTREETASMLQAWLYFGLMQSILGVPVNPADFIDSNDRTTRNPAGGHSTLTSRVALPRYLGAWLKRVKVKDADTLQDTLDQARVYVNSLLQLQDDAPDLDPTRSVRPVLPAPVLLSMAVLGATLETALKDRFPVFPQPTLPFLSHWGRPALLTDELVKRGWCVSDVARLYDSYSTASVLFAATVPRQEVIERKEHAGCTADGGCTARTIDERTYRTRHICSAGNRDRGGGGEGCNWVEAPVEDVKRVLSQGGIPVVEIEVEAVRKRVLRDRNAPRAGREGEEGREEENSYRYSYDYNYKLTCSADRKKKYIAISHVWADGLGCQDRNALPECQIARLCALCAQDEVRLDNGRLARLPRLFRKPKPKPKQNEQEEEGLDRDTEAQRSPPPPSPPTTITKFKIALWIDTLCVPRPRAFRKLAISRMNATYAHATKVLLLDSEMMALPRGSVPDYEVIVRLQGSGWMRRVWTMQEGALGSDGLFVQLGDGVFDVAGAVGRFKAQREKQVGELVGVNGGGGIVARDSGVFFDCFRGLRRSFKYQPGGFDRTHDSALLSALKVLNGRTTTNPGDAYLCLAGMIGLKEGVIGELFNTPVEERTRAMMGYVQDVPSGIVFSAGEKLVRTDDEVGHGKRIEGGFGYGWVCKEFWKSRVEAGVYGRASPTRWGLRMEAQGWVFDTNLPLPGPEEGGLVFEYKNMGWNYRATYDSASAEVVRQYAQRETTASSPAATTNDASSSTLGTLKSFVTTGRWRERRAAYGIIVPDREAIRKGCRGTTSRAALVAITGPPGGKSTREGWKHTDGWTAVDIFCEYICQVMLSGYYDGEQREEAMLWQARRPNGTSDEPDLWLYKSQIWFVC